MTTKRYTAKDLKEGFDKSLKDGGIDNCECGNGFKLKGWPMCTECYSSVIDIKWETLK